VADILEEMDINQSVLYKYHKVLSIIEAKMVDNLPPHWSFDYTINLEEGNLLS
jgi:hypothetical protein